MASRRRRKSYDRRRGDRRRNPLPKLLVACEGAGTEVNYFNGIRAAFNLSDNILIVDRGAQYSAVDYVWPALVNNAKLKLDTKKDSLDQAFAIVDRDKQNQKIKALTQVAQQAYQKPNHYLLISNPCFVLWLILHFQEFGIDSFQFPNGISKCQALKRELHRITTSGVDWPNMPKAEFYARLKAATERAEALDTTTDTERVPPVGVTQLHTLGRILLDLIDENNSRLRQQLPKSIL